MENFIINKRILITGGTGSLGTALVKMLAPHNKVIVYSRNEERQFLCQQEYAALGVKFIIGDIKDAYTLKNALLGCDLLIHAAAMKDTLMCEEQPVQAYLNNLEGSRIVLQCAQDAKVSRTIAISTDKAANPMNVYGATKYIMERMFLEAGRHGAGEFLCIRFGNMIDSSGSLISYWKNRPEISLQITDKDVSRFFFTRSDAARAVIKALAQGKPGTILVPKMKKAKIIDIMTLIRKQKDFPVIGLSPGEKLHEELIGQHELSYTTCGDDFYCIDLEKRRSEVTEIFSSKDAPAWSQQELHQMIFREEREHG